MTVKPLTVVDTDCACSLEEMTERVLRTREQHGDALQRYHEIWYNAPHTWHFTHFLGIGLMKSPNDLWAYQELIALHRPKTIIETGTYSGGSALWFAYLMDMLNIEDGRVLTVDFEDYRRCDHPRITFLAGDSTDPVLASAIRDAVGMVIHKHTCWLVAQDEHHRSGLLEKKCTCGAARQNPILISLDSDHSAEHVRKELELYAPLCEVGDWLVVEDTNISWVGDGGDRGARGGLEDYLLAHPGEFRQDVLSERWLLSMHPGGWLQRVARCR